MVQRSKTDLNSFSSLCLQIKQGDTFKVGENIEVTGYATPCHVSYLLASHYSYSGQIGKIGVCRLRIPFAFM